MHPREGRFRPEYYKGSSKWTTVNERILQPPHTHSQFLSSQPWKYWAGGTYTVSYPENTQEDGRTSIVLTFDWSSADACIRWSIDSSVQGREEAPAYPGVHSGAIEVFNPFSRYRVYWDVPIFSPYVEILNPTRDASKENQKLEPVRGCSVSSKGIETIRFGSRHLSVLILQEVLKGVAYLLICGPRYPQMRKRVTLPTTFEERYSHNWELLQSYFVKCDFIATAALFSRAYIPAGPLLNKAGHVTEEQKQMTIDCIISIFEHFGIIQEPYWIQTERRDWIEDLQGDVAKVVTVDEWQKVEKKWATLASYACVLDLHKGPWAGEDWESVLED